MLNIVGLKDKKSTSEAARAFLIYARCLSGAVLSAYCCGSAVKSRSASLSVRVITLLGVLNVNLLEFTVTTYDSPVRNPSNVNQPNEPVVTLIGCSSVFPVI